MDVYDIARKPPKEALKPIVGGRLKGKTDINPMWRIKMLTELFGMCGFGWKYEIVKQWLEKGANDEISAFCNINLFVKHDDTWSEPIPGTGGSGFIAKERTGLYTSDECYKMALTDAISVACKSLGFAADIYWNSDVTKYTLREPQGDMMKLICPSCNHEIKGLKRPDGTIASPEEILKGCGGVCYKCYQARKKAESNKEN